VLDNGRDDLHDPEHDESGAADDDPLLSAMLERAGHGLTVEPSEPPQGEPQERVPGQNKGDSDRHDHEPDDNAEDHSTVSPFT